MRAVALFFGLAACGAEPRRAVSATTSEEADPSPTDEREVPRAPEAESGPPRCEPPCEAGTVCAEDNRCRADPDAPAVEAPPEPMDRREIQRGLQSVHGELRACAAGSSGSALIRITIESSGRVMAATVVNAPFARTPAAGCMERAVRRLRFSRSNQTITLTVPYGLH